MKPPVANAPDDPLPTRGDLDQCRRCGLWEGATQGVPGTGPSNARMVVAVDTGKVVWMQTLGDYAAGVTTAEA